MVSAKQQKQLPCHRSRPNRSELSVSIDSKRLNSQSLCIMAVYLSNNARWQAVRTDGGAYISKTTNTSVHKVACGLQGTGILFISPQIDAAAHDAQVTW